MKANGAAIAFAKGYRIRGEDVINLKTGRVRKVRYQHAFKSLPYPRFNIYHKKKVITVKAHQLAAYQKYGPVLYERTMVVRHRNNNVENFNLSNVLLGTQSQNIKESPNRHVFPNQV